MENQVRSEKGSIKISEDVVAIVAGLATVEIDGVVGMSGGIAGGIAELLGRKNLSKGVRVEINGNETVIDLFVIVRFGIRIPDVAFKIQENVKRAVEGMTGLHVAEANVHVQGVILKEDKQDNSEV